ncbi:MAG: TolC family protein [Polyangiales bacterium]
MAGASTVRAQPVERFVEAAASSAVDVRESELSAQSRREDEWQALGRLLPSLSARAAYTRNQHEVSLTLPTGASSSNTITITPHDQVEASVTLDVPLVDPAGWARVRAARSSTDAARARIAVSLTDAQRSAARSYFQWAGALALVDSARAALTVAQRSLDRARARQAQGAAVALDVHRARAEIARAEQSLIDAQLSAETAARSLETLSGLRPSQPALGQATLDEEAPLAQWLTLASQTPAVQQAFAEERAARAQSNAAWWALSPTINATATERVTNAAGFGQPANLAAGFSLSWRLDATSIANARASATSTAIAGVRVERAIARARDEIHSAWWQVHSGIARATAARARLDASAIATQSALARLAQGGATEFEVLTAQRDEFDARSSVIQADAELAYARVALRIAAGRATPGGAP